MQGRQPPLFAPLTGRPSSEGQYHREVLAALLPLLLAATPESGSVSALLDRAEAAYFSVKLDEASQLLDNADAVFARETELPPEKPRALLLRAAVKLKGGDAAGATTAARAALFLDPDLKVGPSFPPSLEELLESVRVSLPARVTVRLTGLPAGGAARIDGRDVPPGGIAVLPGPHRVTARAAGYQPFARSFETRGGSMSLTVAMAPIARPTPTPPPPTPTPTPIAVGPVLHPSPTPVLVGSEGLHEGLPREGDARSFAGPGLLALSVASLAGAGVSLYDLSVSTGNRSGAAPSERSAYDGEIQRYQIEAGAAIGAAVVTGILG